MNVAERLTESALSDLVLFSGGHQDRDSGVCVMEAVAWFAGEKHSARPKCACPVVGAFAMRLNDRIRDNARRTELLRPLIPLIAGSKSTRAVELARGFLAADFAVRVAAPRWLDSGPDKLKAHAVALRNVAPIVDKKTARAARAVAWQVYEAANKEYIPAAAAAAAYYYWRRHANKERWRETLSACFVDGSQLIRAMVAITPETLAAKQAHA